MHLPVASTLHAAWQAPPRYPTPAPAPASSLASHALLSTRQTARVFNQPLSFDTSSVTDMHWMFYVRSSLCPVPCVPNLQSGQPLHAAWAAVAHTPSHSFPGPHPASYAVRSTRQNAHAFNQPLSFDTSSVTTMSSMFYVRSSPRLAPNLQSSPPMQAAWAALAPPYSAPHRINSELRPASDALRLTRQWASAFNQPLSFDHGFDTSSVTNMHEMFRVRSAPALAQQPRVVCMPPMPHAAPRPGPRTSPPHRVPSFDRLRVCLISR